MQFIFDMKYAFLVVMGGIQIEAQNIAKFQTLEDCDGDWHSLLKSLDTDSPTFNPRMRLQLTPRGVVDLTEQGHWVYIPGDKINDKSKANGLQKTLVLLQVTYMMLTCITRQAFGLTLTLLEIHTMVHVICAIGL